MTTPRARIRRGPPGAAGRLAPGAAARLGLGCAALLLVLGVAAPARAREPYALTPERVAALSISRLQIDAPDAPPPDWLFRAGDDPRWADPALDDGGWTPASPMDLDAWPGFTGVGWFRLHVAVDPALRDQRLAAVFMLGGAAELYLDGRLLRGWGRVDADPAREQLVRLDPRDPRALLEVPLDGAAEHVLAVRLSAAGASSSPLPFARELVHFTLLPEADPARVAEITALLHRVDDVLGGAYFAVALVFLTLALIYREARVHRYFGFAVLGTTALTVMHGLNLSMTSFEGFLGLVILNGLALALTLAAVLRLTFYLLDERGSRLFWWVFGALLLAAPLFVVGLKSVAGVIFIAAWVLIVRNVALALWRGAERSRLLAGGLAVAVLIILLDLTEGLVSGFRPLAGLGLARLLAADIAVLVVIATMTVHMARRTAKDSRDLVALNRELEARVHERTAELQVAHARSEALLLNVLPRTIAERLQARPGVIADDYPCVTVLFADIVGFTALAATMSSERIVTLLNRVFSAFDQLAERHGLEKIKTIGDAYMVVGGLPSRRSDHAEAIAEFALDMLAEAARLGEELGVPLQLRVGIHSGPVTAGVIGRQKYIYDLWGDAVNTASRMESHGVPAKIQLSEATAALLAARYALEPRGDVEVKGKGPMPTFFLVGRR